MKKLLLMLSLLASFSVAADTKDELITKLETFSRAANGCALYIAVHKGLTDPDCYAALALDPEFDNIMGGLKELNLADELSRDELFGVIHSANNAKRSMKKVRSMIRTIGNQE